MAKILFLAGILLMPLSAMAQDEHPGEPMFSRARLQHAIDQANGVAPVQSPLEEGPGWMTRHPVLTGALIGAAAGMVIDHSISGWANGMTLFGAELGAFGGYLTSESRKAALKYDVAQSRPGVTPARVVARLGVGQGVRGETVGGQAFSGKITEVGPLQFSLILDDDDDRRVAFMYRDIRAIRAKPLGTGGKIAIAAGSLLVISVVGVAAGGGQ